MTDNTVYLSVKHIAMECNKCRRTFYLIEEIAHVCPYCYLDDKRKLVSHHTNEVSRLAKISADMHDEIEKLKRSNAALRGVITKMRNKENQALPVQECGTYQYEVDLCDLDNYNLIKVGITSCDKCDYKEFGYNDNGRCGCYRECTHYHAFKLKPEIKADLESGKAVAKGGKR